MIEFNNVSKSFGKSKALSNINLKLESAKSYALLGPNGSGKTTLIKSILGMSIPSKGNLIVNNQNINKNHQYRHDIGYMPQIGQYPANMTIKQVIEMMKDIREKRDFEIDEDLIDAFKIKAIEDKKTSALSGGTRQKLSACLAFLFNPEILILDEPTAGLDPLSSEILKEKVVKERYKNKLIITTSHILSDLDEIITDVIYLQEGEIAIHDSIENLRQNSGEFALTKIIASHIKNQSIYEKSY